MDRRKFLAATTTGVIATAGCTGFFADQSIRRAEDPWRDVESGTEDGTAYARGTCILPPGTYAVRESSLDLVGVFVAEIATDGTPIDFLVTDAGEFQRYTEGESFEYLGGSLLNVVDDSTQARLDSGSYRLVFDNTVHGRAEGDTNAQIDFALSVRGM